MDIFLGLRETAGPWSMTDEKTGEVRSGDYHNYVIFYGSEDQKISDSTKNIWGYEGFEKKIKVKDFESVFGSVRLVDIKNYFLKPCILTFGRNGEIKSIKFLTEQTERLNQSGELTEKAS